ncbi:unnamed protein product [Amoebophrya sp. A25]|nr:unnamed protein product [Amoebophrya sp. A25]|eukprot:GSA25T00011016001.1
MSLQIAKLKLLGEDYALAESLSDGSEIRIPIPEGKFARPGLHVAFTALANDADEALRELLPPSGQKVDPCQDIWVGPDTNFPKFFGRVCADALAAPGRLFLHSPQIENTTIEIPKHVADSVPDALPVGSIVACDVRACAEGRAEVVGPIWKKLLEGSCGVAIDDPASSSLFGGPPTPSSSSTKAPAWLAQGSVAAAVAGSGGAPAGSPSADSGGSCSSGPIIRNGRAINLPDDDDIDTNLENIRMGTITATITPDGDHTVILTGDREMIFAETAILNKFRLVAGMDVACSIFTNEDGHPLVDSSRPLWELSTPFKEEQTPFFGQYFGRVINLSSHGNGFVDCEALKQQYHHDPFVHQKIMRLCDIHLGDMINFTVHINSSGTPQVSAPVWRRCEESRRLRIGYHSGGGKGLVSAYHEYGAFGGYHEFGSGNYYGGPYGGKKGGKMRGKYGKHGSYGEKGGTTYAASAAAGGAGDQTSAGSNSSNASTDPGTAASGGNGAAQQGGGGGAQQSSGAPTALAGQQGKSGEKGKSGGSYGAGTGSPLLGASHGHYGPAGGKGSFGRVWEFAGALPGSDEARYPDRIGDHEGYIKNVNSHGHGFVSSYSFHDTDVFVHKKVMDRCKLGSGDRLRFNVHVNATGTPQCSAPVWVLRAGMGPYGGRGGYKGGGHFR